MPNVGDIIRADDFNGAGIKAGAVVPFYNVTLSGRYPIFWGESEANTGWLVCDGGSDLHGGNVPNLSNRFIMGVTSVSGAKKTGGAEIVALSVANLPSHTHSLSGASTKSAGGHIHRTYCWGGGPRHGCINAADFTTANSYYSDSIMDNSGTHMHTISGTIGATGSGTAHENRPPYYTLIFCVKLP